MPTFCVVSLLRKILHQTMDLTHSIRCVLFTKKIHFIQYFHFEHDIGSVAVFKLITAKKKSSISNVMRDEKRKNANTTVVLSNTYKHLHLKRD